MAQETPQPDLMDYEAMHQEALRGVVKAALKRAASPQGLPGGHHFYITFRTKAAGVSGPPDLLGKYPEEMTIVLQHQYWDLAPGETFFAVTLKFGGQPKRLSVPYAAVTRFYDPSVQFSLQFEAPEDEPDLARPSGRVTPLSLVGARPPAEEPEAPAADARPAEPEAETPPEDGPKVVSLDQFRKK